MLHLECDARKSIYVGTPKSQKQRSVPLPAFLLPYLARQREGKARDALPVRRRNGGHLRRSHPVLGWFEGANVKAVQRMLGHASAAMTLDVYSDLFDDDLEAVATALDQARSQKTVGKNVGTRWAVGRERVRWQPTSRPQHEQGFTL